ncbi:putative cytochrome P450 [Lasiosphaeria ovina]|uniref:Cytochrome P450 n=1 Tax=Lasiosphaeria ovina TaxID=92902 RepID=A0AAE0NFZ1_9PEZI|nr:putative cytochrome P450 [Lasiosphaeria ovina]
MPRHDDAAASRASLLTSLLTSLSAYQVVAVALVGWLLYRLIPRPSSGSQPRFPVWATLEIPLVSYVAANKGGLAQRIYSALSRFGGSLFGISSTHQVLVNTSGVEKFMSQGLHSLTPEPMHNTLLVRVFGRPDSPRWDRMYYESARQLTIPVERMFLNDAAATATLERGAIAKRAASFVTFSADPARTQPWEKSAGIRVVRPDTPGKPGAVEANLQSLTRDFGAHMAISLLYGRDFVARYTTLLEDFWRFDNDMFPLLMIGIPDWAPFRMMREAKASRTRLIDELEAFYRRLGQHSRGEPVDFGADMSDAGDAVIGRQAVYDKYGWTMRERGHADMGVIWGQNGNTQPMLFWYLVYLYSTPGFVDELRRGEVASCVTLTDGSPSEIAGLDMGVLSRDCPRMKAALFETYRLASDPTSIRYVARDAKLDDGARKHDMRQGMYVSVPHSVIQRDPDVFAEPDRFVPDRFLEVDEETGKTVARYGRLRPWGFGPGICKGRTFAEKEILALAATIIALWDINPVGGTWKVPTMMPGTGVKKPVEDVRVVISRRVF